VKKFAFPKRERLTRANDFKRVFSAGKRFSDRNLILYVLANALGFSRLGLVVSRKFGNAVRRNRFKRLMREVFRLNKGKISGGTDIIVIPARTAACELKSLEDSFLHLVEEYAKECDGATPRTKRADS
jgi:ribonuclease P protein component